MRNLLIIISLLLTNILSLPLSVADNRKAEIIIEPQPVDLQTIPLPGKPIKLSVVVKNSREPSLWLHALALLDGKLMDVPLKVKTFDNSDNLVYSTQIPSPISELEYSFILHKSNGQVTTSKRFEIKRQCIPNTDPVNDTVPEKTESGIRELYEKLEVINRELTQYETAISFLESLEDSLK